MVKSKEKKRAVNLRRKGFSYGEILEQIPVAKSTLSLWLREVGLSKKQKQRLTQKKLDAARRGAQVQRAKRLEITRQIKEKARVEAAKININREKLWLIGTILYWAEGAKDREDRKSSRMKFGNSDPGMMKMFIKWLREICKVKENRIRYEIYIHENNKHRIKEVVEYWADEVGISRKYLNNVYFKVNRIKTNRKNIGKNYFGLLNLTIRRSTDLNRRIAGWIEGITNSIAGSTNGRSLAFEASSLGSSPSPAVLRLGRYAPSLRTASLVPRRRRSSERA